MATVKDIAIYGAGGFGREVACLINRINEVQSTWNLVGFFDDDASLKGNQKIEFPNIVHPDFKIADSETFRIGKGNIRTCFEMINFNSYASFSRIFRRFSAPSRRAKALLLRAAGINMPAVNPSRPHCGLKSPKNPSKNNL